MVGAEIVRLVHRPTFPYILDFHEYAGLIYDGAFSEHISSSEKKGLTGEDIDEEKAKEIVNQFYGADKIDNIESHGYCCIDITFFHFYIKIK